MTVKRIRELSSTIDIKRRLSRYEKIADTISLAIGRGVYEPGEQLPSMRDLARSLKASINTIKSSVSLLQDRGLVETRERRGVFVVRAPEISRDDADLGESDLTIVANDDELDTETVIRLDRDWMPAGLVPIRRISAALRAEAASGSSSITGRASPEDTLSLRTFVAQRLFLHGATVAPEDVVLTDGVLDGVAKILQFAHKKNGVVAIETPTYYPFIRILRQLGLPVFEVPLDEHGIRVDILIEGIQVHKVSTLLTTPSYHNPTGVVATVGRRARLFELSEQYDLVVIEDDANRETYWNRKPPPPIIGMGKNKNIYLCSSFEQVLTPAIKLGWVVANGKGRALSLDAKAIDFNVSGLAVAVLTRIIESGGFVRHRERFARLLAERREVIRNTVLATFPAGSIVSEPEGGYALWIELPVSFSVSKIRLRALVAGIAFAPGTWFSSVRAYDRHIRITVHDGDSRELIAVERLGTLLKQEVNDQWPIEQDD